MVSWWIAIWNGLQANVKKQLFFIGAGQFFLQNHWAFGPCWYFLLRPMSSFVSTSRDQMSSLVGPSDDGWLQVVNMGRFPTPWGCGESLSGKELSKFCMSRSLKMMNEDTCFYFEPHMGVLLDLVFCLNHTWVLKKGYSWKKHTFNNSWAILLDVIGCHFFFYFFFSGVALLK